MRQRILATLLITSFGVMAATASAQDTAPNNSPRNAPIGTSVPAPGDGSADPAYGAKIPATDASTNVTSPVDSNLPAGPMGYKSARAACEQQPIASRARCLSDVNAQYTGVAPECQKVSGSALDACLNGADTGQ